MKSEYQARVKFWKDNPPYGLEAKLLGAGTKVIFKSPADATSHQRISVTFVNPRRRNHPPSKAE